MNGARPQPSPSRWLRSAGLLVVAILLTACSGLDVLTGHPSRIDPDPVRIDRSAPPADLRDQHPPVAFADQTIVDASWSVHPKVAGDLFLGLRSVDDAALELTAVDASGRIRWAARRPLACTGFALSTVGGRTIAVLTDLEPGTDTATVTTATAYDLATGEELWGPVEVPGGHVGPGLVYSEVPAATMGETGPRVALDPATGAVAADERDLAGDVIGEYDGIVLIRTGGEVIARRATDRGEESWRVPIRDLGPIEAEELVAAPPPNVVSNDGTALLGDMTAGHSLVDLTEGTVLHRGLRDARTDLETGTRVALTTDAELRGLDAAGQTLWRRTVDPDTRIEAVGAGLVFLRSHRQLQALELAGGEPVEAHAHVMNGTAVAPAHVSASGAAVLDTLPGPVLVTSTTSRAGT